MIIFGSGTTMLDRFGHLPQHSLINTYGQKVPRIGYFGTDQIKPSINTLIMQPTNGYHGSGNLAFEKFRHLCLFCFAMRYTKYVHQHM